jgi:hypothetical protein
MTMVLILMTMVLILMTMVLILMTMVMTVTTMVLILMAKVSGVGLGATSGATYLEKTELIINVLSARCGTCG